MNRKKALMALTLAALCAAAQAQGSVTIYGVADVYAGDTKTSGGTGTQGHVKLLNSGGLTTSFIGFRGSEDLGNGLKAVFGLESFIRIDAGLIGRNDADPFWGRLAMVGLEGPWGAMTLGRHVTPYSLATTGYTPFAGSTTFSTAFAQVYRNNLQGDTRFNNSIRYRSPGSTGLLADVVLSLGQEISQGPNRHQNRALDSTLRYVGANWGLGVGTRQIDLNTNDNGRDQKAYMVGGSYDFKFIQVFGQLHDIKETYTNAALAVTRRTYETGVAVPLAVGALWATYARSTIRDASPATSDRRVGWALGYDHPLSKRTDAYAAAVSDVFKNPRVETRTWGAGLRHRF